MKASVSSTDRVLLTRKDTTLYGGFNTAVTDFNFIKITNTLGSNPNDSGEITFIVPGRGTLADAEVINQTFTVAAGKRVDVNIHDLAGNDFGPIRIVHNCPPGGLRAVNVQYKITNQNPLDFQPVLSVPFREGLE